MGRSRSAKLRSETTRRRRRDAFADVDGPDGPISPCVARWESDDTNGGEDLGRSRATPSTLRGARVGPSRIGVHERVHVDRW